MENYSYFYKAVTKIAEDRIKELIQHAIEAEMREDTFPQAGAYFRGCAHTVYLAWCDITDGWQLVPARIVWTRFCNSGGLLHGIGLTDFIGCSEAQFFKTPMTIVAILERGNCRAHFLDIVEDATMDGLLL